MMMMPSLSMSSSSSISTTVMVDKATSDLLAGPDWTLNMEICDICNSNHGLGKDVVKEVKRRLQHKNPKVQLLTVTLLETMVKNCGEYIHYHFAERKILDEMIKIVKKKGDMFVRDKILILLDSWQEAFGGPGGKYSQYYWACDELRRCGIQFPQRAQHSAPIITPLVSHPPRAAQVGFGMPSNTSRRLDEAMSSEIEDLSFSTLESIRGVLELLKDMLQAVNPSDLMAGKDEVIIDLVDRCRVKQKKLTQMITTTTDEELLSQGLEINDSLQAVLAKHDAIVSGAPLSNHNSLGSQPSEPSSPNISEPRDNNPAPSGKASSYVAPLPNSQGEEDEEDDEFAQLARRHSKAQSTPWQSAATGATEDTASSSSSNSNAPVVMDAPAPAPANDPKEQELIDLLSIVLSTSSTSSENPQLPNSASVDAPFQESSNGYVVLWAQPQPQPQPQQPQLQTQYRSGQPRLQPQSQQGYSQNSSGFPPPPWEATSGYTTNQNLGSNPYMSQGTMTSSSNLPLQNSNSSQYGDHQMYSSASINFSSPIQGMRSLQHVNSFQNPSMNGNLYSTSQETMNASSMTNSSSGIPSGHKPSFIPSYRLFEDLDVFGTTEGEMKSDPYPSALGNPDKNMIAGRR